MVTTYAEILHRDWQQRFGNIQILHVETTPFQKLEVFSSPSFGTVMALDGVIQTTTADEFIYHEMMVHPPLVAHGAVKRVLIIGGGDGGCLREVLKHPVESVTLVEIDAAVIAASKRFLPELSAGAFDDPRTRVVVGDGLKFIAETDEIFDVILVDSTDPEGPGEVLFTEAFYADCARALSPRGVVVTQCGVPFLQPAGVTRSYRRLCSGFSDVTFTVCAVPTYVGGVMTLGWASADPTLRCLGVESLRAVSTARGLTTRYYSPEVHLAAFALPRYIQDLLSA
ncbi:MAG: polyamine aminopropyltransferase [Rhodospirillaceae bacterium]|nr:polyamine aminopropyltransferase [Rhodospirillaceae bacterium]